MAQAAFKPERAMWSKKFTYDYWPDTRVPVPDLAARSTGK